MLLLEDWVQLKFKMDIIAGIVGAVIGALLLIVSIVCVIIVSRKD